MSNKKIFDSMEDAIADIVDGSTILFGGFGGAGVPYELITALAKKDLKNIVAVNNNAGYYEKGIAELIARDQVSKLMCSYPVSKESYVFLDKYKQGKIDVEVVPQGTLAERLRAGGSGIEAFYTPTGAGTEVAEGKEEREINGVSCIMETALKGDFAFVSAKQADRWGNLTYKKSGRNFNPLMAMAGKITIVEVDEIVENGELEPESIITPGVFVQRIVKRRGQ